jgi:pyruvate, orthophosphate dikinase
LSAGLRLGSSTRPLLLSVRSGAPVSMPGMLETVLNVGLSDVSIRGLIALTGNPGLAYDSYRRLVESFAAVVDGCSREPFERALGERLEAASATSSRELTARALEELTRDHLDR